jgi:hypothetical protein
MLPTRQFYSRKSVKTKISRFGGVKLDVTYFESKYFEEVIGTALLASLTKFFI